MKFLDLAKQVADELAVADPRRLYSELCADVGRDEDIAILKQLTDAGEESWVTELLTLDARCHDLIREDAPEAEVRASTEAFITCVRAMREAYRRT